MSSTSGRVAASASLTASMDPAVSRSSGSTNQTYSPVACASPRFRAGPGPPLSARWITRSLGSCRARASRISPQRSAEASSTAITSMPGNGWPSTESRHPPRYSSTPETGSTTLIRGCAAGSLITSRRPAGSLIASRRPAGSLIAPRRPAGSLIAPRCSAGLSSLRDDSARSRRALMGTAVARPGDAGARENGLSARRLLPGEPVHRLPEEVGMAVVPGVLLDQVEQDPSQAGCPAVGQGAPGQPVQAAVGQRLRDQGAGAGHGVLPERQELLGGLPRGRVPVPVGVGVPVHRVPRGLRVSPVQPLGAPIVLDTGQVLEHPAQGH